MYIFALDLVCFICSGTIQLEEKEKEEEEDGEEEEEGQEGDAAENEPTMLPHESMLSEFAARTSQSLAVMSN